MPTVRPGLLAQVPTTTFNKGSADSISARAAFPASPFYDGTYSADTQVQAAFRNPRELTAGVFNDAGYAFGTVNRDYQDAPDFATVRTGGGGLPGSAFAPNIASAAEVNNPRSIPDSGVLATNRSRGGGGAFGGNGMASPSATSVQITSKKLGDPLELGKRTR